MESAEKRLPKEESAKGGEGYGLASEFRSWGL